MKLFNRNIFAILAASAGLLTSCSDDVLNRDNGNFAGDDGLVIYVPDVPQDLLPLETGTRAGTPTDYTPEEGKIDQLRLFAYMDGQELPKTVDLLNECETLTSGVPTGYKGYKLDLDNGNYHMYVVANVDFTDPESIKESDLLLKGVAVPADLSKGLPMSCTHKDLDVRYDNPGFNPVGNGTIAINSGGSTTIKADLKFAVAKVRVTLLNDMRPDEQIGAANVKGHEDKSSIFRDGTYTSAAGSELDIKSKGSYKKMPTIPATGIKDVNVDALEALSSPSATAPWAWQTVFYVPEQLDQSERSTIASINLGSTAIPVPVSSTVNGKKVVERSHFYDFIGSANGKFYLFVENWTPISMIGSLNGTTYLDLDKTSLTIEGGEKYEINFKSNAPVTYLSPEFAEQAIYDISVDNENGKITVSLSSEIDHEEFNTLYADNEWKYFTLFAGTIEKRIMVDDLLFHDFITSDTDIVTIDVAVRKQSGDYSGDILVELHSNLANFTIENIDWPESAGDGNPKSLRILDKNKREVADGEELTTEDGKVILYVSYADLNSSRELWKENHELAIMLKGKDFEGNDVSCKVNIVIRAAVDTYTIHFYAPDWEHPHIYAYQCLQLPSGINYTNGGKAGQIVGEHKDAAALEYDFTGGAAFKGWNVGSYNDPNASGNGKDNNGFFVFDSDGWAPGTQNWTNHYYDMDFCESHRKKVAELGLCSYCTGSNHKRCWPGIHMLPDDETGEGWWKFELSGVATPGKTLIMFTDLPNQDKEGHNYDNNVSEDKRYPKAYQPGLALFDYPTKEAWFVYQNTSPLSFYSYNPQGEPSQSYTYRIYWPYTENGTNQWRGLNVWQGGDIWGNKEYTPSNFNSGQIQGASGTSKYGKYNNGYAYLEFRVWENPRSGTFNYMRIKAEGDYYKEGDQSYYEQTVNFSKFKLIDGVYHYTITSFANGEGGKPSGEPIPPPVDDELTFRIYWYWNSDWFQGLNFFNDTHVKENNAKYTTYPATQTFTNGTYNKYDDTYCYYEFKAKRNFCNTFSLERRCNDAYDGGYQHKKENIPYSTFSLDADGNMSMYYYDENNYKSGKP